MPSIERACYKSWESVQRGAHTRMETSSSSSGSGSGSGSGLMLSVAMVVGFRSITFSQRWVRAGWLHAFLFLVISVVFSATSISSSPTYADHCGSVVPESPPTRPDLTTSRLTFDYGYFTGGAAILSQGSPSSFYSSESSKSISFRTRRIYPTETKGVFKVEARLALERDRYYSTEGLQRGRPSFPQLEGFWSESSGELCMVGLGSAYSSKGNLLRLAAVLKLHNVKNTNTIYDLVTGTLESLDSHSDSNYFEQISMLFFPEMKYEHTPALEETYSGCPVPQDQSLGTDSISSICSLISWGSYEVEYAHGCNPSKNCTPFGEGIGYLPQFVSTRVLHCLEEEEKMHVMVQFVNNSYGYYRTFNPSTTLVGEGLWDVKKDQLCLSACRILNEGDSLHQARVQDCSIRLSLRFPAIWSIRNRSGVVGEIWSNKSVSDSGFFRKIMFHGGSRNRDLPGLKYEYSELQRANKACLEKNPAKKKGAAYPSGHSSNMPYDMQFDMAVRNSTHSFGWAYSELITLGDEFVSRSRSFVVVSGVADVSASEIKSETNANGGKPMNVSYRISLSLEPGVKFGGMVPNPSNFTEGIYTPIEIAAEGIYDPETGVLCMVGCRKLSSPIKTSSKYSMDCEILVKLQFPPLNSKNGQMIKGSMESTREKSDPLYFEHLDLSASSFYGARQSIWRMDFEIIMVLISHTLSCICVGLQIFYAKKHSEVLPSISLLMLVVLTLGYMIPLVLNFEALFMGNGQQNALLESGGWFKANEVIVRVITMVVFLLQCRLFQLTWTAKLREGHEKGSWAAEKKVLYLTLPLYAGGCLIALFFNKGENENGSSVSSYAVRDYQQHSLWGDLRSYAGLALDGFLFPQVLLNMFRSSTEKALSHSFYVGTTAVRLFPHAYDLYRAHNNAVSFNGSYIYANPGADLYSTAWDIIVPCGGLLFAAIIFFQQRFGGCCILPKRFRELKGYEKIPVVSS